MRNSLVPILIALVIVAVGFALVRPHGHRGTDGPTFSAGILRLPKNAARRITAMPLDGTTTATLAGAADERPWRVVLVQGDDRSAVTRAVQYALGEALFAADIVCVLDPYPEHSVPQPPLPLPVDRVVRISTVRESLPDTPQAAMTADVVLLCSEPRLPASHPAANRQVASVGTGCTITVRHQASGGDGDWPARWAAAGRAIVGAALGQLAPAGLRRDTAPAVAWSTPLPLPPQVPEIRWRGCFQYPQVRGWTGRVEGRTVPGKLGVSESALASVERILASGRWQSLPDSGLYRLWQREREGAVQWFSVCDDGTGWDLALWQEQR